MLKGVLQLEERRAAAGSRYSQRISNNSRDAKPFGHCQQFWDSDFGFVLSPHPQPQLQPHPHHIQLKRVYFDVILRVSVVNILDWLLATALACQLICVGSGHDMRGMNRNHNLCLGLL